MVWKLKHCKEWRSQESKGSISDGKKMIAQYLICPKPLKEQSFNHMLKKLFVPIIKKIIWAGENSSERVSKTNYSVVNCSEKVLKKIARIESLVCCEEEKWFKKRKSAETGSEGTMWKHKKLLYSFASQGQKNSLRLKC